MFAIIPNFYYFLCCTHPWWKIIASAWGRQPEHHTTPPPTTTQSVLQVIATSRATGQTLLTLDWRDRQLERRAWNDLNLWLTVVDGIMLSHGSWLAACLAAAPIGDQKHNTCTRE